MASRSATRSRRRRASARPEPLHLRPMAASPPYLCLAGPTASGKTAAALAIAAAFEATRPVEIVSVDSALVYRGMDIGTAKPTAAERAEVPHHLIDLVEPHEEFTVARFQRAFVDVLAGITARRHRALLVGGTGLYLRAAIDGLSIPGRHPDVVAELETRPTTALFEQLEEVDPEAAARIVPSNRRRILRALEVTIGSGRPFSSYGPGLEAYPRTEFALAGVALPPAVVARRIEARYEQQLDNGLVDEGAALRAGAEPLSRTAAQALGYRELAGHLRGEYTLDEAVDAAVLRTRRFVRRQRAWFRRDPRIEWFAADEDPE